MAEGGVGLDPVICDLCEDKPAQFFCRTCDGNMCIDCKNDHKKKKMFLRHDVVKMTLTRKMELDGFGYCNVHPENKYELSCQSCEIPQRSQHERYIDCLSRRQTQDIRNDE